MKYEQEGAYTKNKFMCKIMCKTSGNSIEYRSVGKAILMKILKYNLHCM